MRAVSADPPQVPVVSAPVRRHLLAVWNPVLGADAMEQHLRVLQDAARRHRHGKLKADEENHPPGKRCRRPKRSRYTGVKSRQRCSVRE